MKLASWWTWAFVLLGTYAAGWRVGPALPTLQLAVVRRTTPSCPPARLTMLKLDNDEDSTTDLKPRDDADSFAAYLVPYAAGVLLALSLACAAFYFLVVSST
mmetsp:Transcript_9364/g.24208  ORF Transcript_9364/g.24208 Transcript_9364/m.24208 type:complete len:102 (-) Transcript_9364:415-720(-)